jgi:hypothetical protein
MMQPLLTTCQTPSILFKSKTAINTKDISWVPAPRFLHDLTRLAMSWEKGEASLLGCLQHMPGAVGW